MTCAISLPIGDEQMTPHLVDRYIPGPSKAEMTKQEEFTKEMDKKYKQYGPSLSNDKKEE